MFEYSLTYINEYSTIKPHTDCGGCQMFDHKQRRFAMITTALQAAPLDQHSVAAKIHMTVRWTREYLKQMCEEELIHVCRWVYIGPSHAYPNALYKLGCGKNVPAPGAQTSAVKQRAVRRRLAADQERKDAHIARRRALRKLVKRDPLHVAFYGAQA